jgi:hypothetical protein
MAVQFTAIAATAETTIVTAPDAGGSNKLKKLFITTPNAAASVLTLREKTGGNIRAKFDFPNAAVAPNYPLEVTFDPPLVQNNGLGQNWTLQASVNASGYNVEAEYEVQ